MDWKAWYADEARSPEGRAAIAAALGRRRGGDAEVRRVLRCGGAVSFPHTTLGGSADPLARVAASVVAEGFARVVALGVLHLSTLPEPERSLGFAAAAGDAAALARVGGAFTERSEPGAARSEWLRPGGDLLAREFSLDLFRTVLAEASRPAPPPPMTCVYVGPTTTAAGPTAAVAGVATALRPLLGPDVALVATGDLVHAGSGYAPDEEVAALPADAEEMRARFEEGVRRMLALAFAGDAAGADLLARELRSDQRHVLPVLVALLGRGTRAALRSFALTDYAGILGRPPPCVVASALATFEPPRAA